MLDRWPVSHETCTKTIYSQFKKGVSGNPTRRPVGSRNKALACEQMLEGESDELLRVAVDSFLRNLAKEGNVHAVRLCLKRIVPPRKEPAIHLELQPIVSPQDLPIQFQNITTAIAQGITP